MLKSPNKQITSEMVDSIDDAADTMDAGSDVNQTQDAVDIDNINQERDPVQPENTVASNSFMSPFNMKSPLKELNYSNVLDKSKTGSTSPNYQKFSLSKHPQGLLTRIRNKKIQKAYAASVNAKMTEKK